ncbi:MAG: TetR/AcrR family transcriptional regulator [Rubrivivax sp.]|nr:MAG: TetR/AcrR family transcriptional regulator [Rubrivivax sp.]
MPSIRRYPCCPTWPHLVLFRTLMSSDHQPLPRVSFRDLPRRYGGASAEERKQQRRERLLDAAFEVFGRKGYKETTLRLICAQARMTDRYFYEHFESLDAIFLQVRQRLATELMERLLQASARPEPDPVLLIRHALTAFFEYVKEDPRRARVLLLDAMSFGLTSTEVAETRLNWYAQLIGGRLKARYPNLPPQLDFQLVASGFLGQVTYVATVWTLRKFDTPVDQMVDHASYAWMGLHHWLADYDASVPIRSAG